MSEFRLLIKCPRCRMINAPHTPYFKCYNCFYVDDKDVSYRVNELEREQRKKIQEIVKFLFSSNLPNIEFPESSLNPETEDIDWGWVDKNSNTIFLPRKTFYLPNDELTDTVVHEACHLLSEPNHQTVWKKLYPKQREKVFTHFSNFVNLTNPQVKFNKGYKIYPY